jgi:penicillin-binding protein 1C
VVLDNRSGEILAWVGSPDFWADTAGQVDMVVNLRQPGSALKPFLYALAFDRGATPATVLADVAKTYQTSGGPYHPRNYDRSYHGPVRAREALGSSYNVPAVEIADRIGYATLLHGLHQAGFGSLNRNAEFYGLGLALGNGDVSLLELANGYRALANGGVWRRYTWKADGAAESGRWAGPERRFVSPHAAAMVLDILADPGARLPAFGAATPFDFPFRVAAKSGTSRHFTDNWAVATTANFTVAAWAGNFSGRPMEGVSGVTGAGPLLHRAVLLVARRYSPGNLIQPTEAGLVPIRICRLSGMRATQDCPGMTEWFKPDAIPDAYCNWHQGKGVRLPEEYAEWEGTVGTVGTDGREVGRSEPLHPSTPPCPVAPTPVNPSSLSFRPSVGLSICPPPPPVRPSARLSITSPQDGDHYRLPPGVDPRYATVALRASGAPENVPVRWYVDGRLTTDPRWRLVPGSHRFRAEAVGLSAEVSVVVEE